MAKASFVRGVIRALLLRVFGTFFTLGSGAFAFAFVGDFALLDGLELSYELSLLDFFVRLEHLDALDFALPLLLAALALEGGDFAFVRDFAFFDLGELDLDLLLLLLLLESSDNSRLTLIASRFAATSIGGGTAGVGVAAVAC